MNISSKLKRVPTQPGVYQFKNDKGDIIYIGKAKNLRHRVRSYFQKNKYQTPKNQSMIKRIADLEWIVTGSEVEALLTEANLIKEYRPKYNVDLKDDKSFPFIRITNEPYPQVFLTREVVRDGSRYFGPYTNVNLLRKMLKAVHRIFPIRSCSYALDAETVKSKKIKVCLDYHIKKCEGPCEGFVSQKQYNEMIKRVVQFLHGNTSRTEAYLQKMMEAAARELRFEDAAIYRDQLQAVKSFKERQRKVAADFEDRDVFALAQEEDLGIMVIVRIRRGRLFSREKISLQGLNDNQSATLRSVLTRFYLESDFIPREITLPFPPEDEEELLEWLRSKQGRAVKFVYPQRGEKARENRVAYQNARLLLGEWILERKKRREFIPNSVKQLQDDLNLEAPPRRIEAFDISHLGGTNTVASMVCFIDGKPRKSEYRKFKIKMVSGVDDFAAMREVVYRRYKRVQDEQGSLPDLILIDGGKGQLSMAVSALRELGLDYIAVVGLAKRLEEVFIPGNSEPQSIPKQSAGLFLLRRIRDEAHRFAIAFQRKKRSQSMTESIFSVIPGMGSKRLEKLLSNYPSVDAIANEDASSLNNRTGIPERVCEAVIRTAIEFQQKHK
ncbi:MAG: excinuclease ABC subunit C [FCB group bacterium]|nr:excinuclease ABC subunit C [FCB group bacterium]